MSQVQQNISAASNSLKQALTYKTMGSAAAGAVVGTVVGGPLGLLAGIIFCVIHGFYLNNFLTCFLSRCQNWGYRGYRFRNR